MSSLHESIPSNLPLTKELFKLQAEYIAKECAIESIEYKVDRHDTIALRAIIRGVDDDDEYDGVCRWLAGTFSEVDKKFSKRMAPILNARRKPETPFKKKFKAESEHFQSFEDVEKDEEEKK